MTIGRDEALAILSSDTPHTLTLLDRAREYREKHFGKTVVLHVLANAKSGACSEDCAFCSQSARYETGIDEYPLVEDDELFDRARRADEANAEKFCIVTATRGTSEKLLNRLCPAIARIKATFPRLKICTSLGLLDADDAGRLREAGVDRYNHNLESSERFFPNIVTTHAWSDRANTVGLAKRAGMEACCGGIVGLGETDEDIVDMFFSLKNLDVDSVPINLFNARPGTPFEKVPPLTGLKALRILSLARILMPDKDIRCAGGREAILKDLQPFCLFAVNSIFTNGYLTTSGQGEDSDERMIRQMGYQVTRE